MMIIAFLIVAAGVLMACSSADPAPAPITEITLVATDIAYDTNRLEVVAGQPVRITMRNEGALEHDFSIMELPHTGEVMAEEAEGDMDGHDMDHMDIEPEIHVAPPLGEERSIEFTPTTPGEYDYFCTVNGHKEAGMVGTLVVTAP
jgi:uncharacterized cupredoxin-like copper-binding protein